MSNATSDYLADKDFVLAKCRYFVDAQVWPRQKLFPERWLENFTSAEQPYAVHLLNQFLFFSDDLVGALLLGGMGELSRLVVDPTSKNDDAKSVWAEFLRKAIVTYPTGERPRPTDSGLAYARKARQILGFPDNRILEPAECIEHLMTNGACPVLFVDDFLGTGRQFTTTWDRPLDAGGTSVSFHELSSTLAFDAIYLPNIATSTGVQEVETHSPTVRLAPTHVIPPQYSALAPDSLLWPEGHQGVGREVIETASKRAKMLDTNGNAASDWQGYHKLGLCIGFEHGVPDATMPLFYWPSNGWHPLLTKA